MDERGWQAVAWAVAAVAAVLLGTKLLGGGGDPPPVRVDEPAGAARDGHARQPGLYVHVAGAVRRPGLYRLPADARVLAAIRRAGGPTARGELDLVNLAARLRDGQQVVVPAGAGGAEPGVAGVFGGSPGGPVSLGSATVEQLDGLDGIGPTLAERIVAARRERGGFASVDELGEVEGIGEKRLEALKAALAP